MDPIARNQYDFLLRSRNNVRYRILHHHVFDTDLVVQMMSIAGFKVLFAGTHRLHIIVLGQKMDDKIRIGERAVESLLENDANATEP
jgi:hypothetical protein